MSPSRSRWLQEPLCVDPPQQVSQFIRSLGALLECDGNRRNRLGGAANRSAPIRGMAWAALSEPTNRRKAPWHISIVYYSR